MTIFRSSFVLLALALPSAARAQDPDLTPRSPLEAIVLGDAVAAKAHLEALADRAIASRDMVVAELLAAGFEPDRGYPGCAFYGYHRRTTQAGAARSAQVALCDNGKTMVLVLGILPPERRGGGMSTVRGREKP
ncbi:hypothetical protein ACLBKU_07975 [Erythrobacter sp. NE805]|uniref:hypothetical protein n=1 Tax=Erythrobacter sp. NE805 TaxID=3389875 RepID=UPI00396B08BB